MNENTILYHVKKDLCKMIIETEQKIQEWENKKGEVLKKHPDHRFSELRSLKQNLFIYELYLEKINDGLTYKEINNCYHEIKDKFIEHFPEVRGNYMVDSMIPDFRPLCWKYFAVFDGYINFNEDLDYKLTTWYSAKDLGYNGIRVEFYDDKTRTRKYIGTYGADDFLKTDFSNYEQSGLEFCETLLDEDGEEIRSSFVKSGEAERHVKARQEERERENAYIELKAYGVVCLNNGLVFKHHSNAANYAGLKSGNSILKCCKCEQKASGKHPETGEKLQWMYYKDYEMLTEEKELKN